LEDHCLCYPEDCDPCFLMPDDPQCDPFFFGDYRLRRMQSSSISLQSTPCELPCSLPFEEAILAYWDDLDMRAGGKLHVYSFEDDNGDGVVAVTFKNMSYNGADINCEAPLTLQVQLKANNNVRVMYAYTGLRLEEGETCGDAILPPTILPRDDATCVFGASAGSLCEMRCQEDDMLLVGGDAAVCTIIATSTESRSGWLGFDDSLECRCNVADLVAVGILTSGNQANLAVGDTLDVLCPEGFVTQENSRVRCTAQGWDTTGAAVCRVQSCSSISINSLPVEFNLSYSCDENWETQSSVWQLPFEQLCPVSCTDDVMPGDECVLSCGAHTTACGGGYTIGCSEDFQFIFETAPVCEPFPEQCSRSGTGGLSATIGLIDWDESFASTIFSHNEFGIPDGSVLTYLWNPSEGYTVSREDWTDATHADIWQSYAGSERLMLDRFYGVSATLDSSMLLFGEEFHSVTIMPTGVIKVGEASSYPPHMPNTRPEDNVGVEMRGQWAALYFDDGIAGVDQVYIDVQPSRVAVTLVDVEIRQASACERKMTMQAIFFSDGTVKMLYPFAGQIAGTSDCLRPLLEQSLRALESCECSGSCTVGCGVLPHGDSVKVGGADVELQCVSVTAAPMDTRYIWQRSNPADPDIICEVPSCPNHVPHSTGCEDKFPGSTCNPVCADGFYSSSLREASFTQFRWTMLLLHETDSLFADESAALRVATANDSFSDDIQQALEALGDRSAIVVDISELNLYHQGVELDYSRVTIGADRSQGNFSQLFPPENLFDNDVETHMTAWSYRRNDDLYDRCLSAGGEIPPRRLQPPGLHSPALTLSPGCPTVAVEFHFPSAVVVDAMSFHSGSVALDPQFYKLEGSNDGVVWQSIVDHFGTETLAPQNRSFETSNLDVGEPGWLLAHANHACAVNKTLRPGQSLSLAECQAVVRADPDCDVLAIFGAGYCQCALISADCDPGPVTTGQHIFQAPSIRLSEGYQGLVEYYFNGTWGSVVGLFPDPLLGSVICRQLGLGFDSMHFHATDATGFLFARRLQAESQPVWMTQQGITCRGWEQRIEDCDHLRGYGHLDREDGDTLRGGQGGGIGSGMLYVHCESPLHDRQCRPEFGCSSLLQEGRLVTDEDGNMDGPVRVANGNPENGPVDAEFTMSDCQQSCVDDPECTGFSWGFPWVCLILADNACEHSDGSSLGEMGGINYCFLQEGSFDPHTIRDRTHILNMCDASLQIVGPQQTCRAVPCDQGSLPLVFSNVADCVGTGNGEHCRAYCEEGYSASSDPDGAAIMTCEATGRFSGPSICSANQCHTMPNSLVGASCENKTTSEQCTVSCAVGWSGPDAVSTCLRTGEFSDPEVCVAATCSNDSLPTGAGVDASDCFGKTTSEQCLISCNQGYTNSNGRGVSTFLCEGSGSFSGSVTCAANLCDADTLPQHGVDNSECAGKRTGEECAVSCHPGFSGVATTLSCDNSGVFSGSITCNAITCNSETLPVQEGVNTSSCRGKTTGQACNVFLCSRFHW